MAAKNASAFKKIADVFSNEEFSQKLTYDFSSEGGATADTYRLGQVNKKCVLAECTVYVETAATSGGSAVVNIGVEGGDTDAMLDNTNGAVASLTADAAYQQAAAQGLVIDADGYITMSIATADLTAGKIHVWLSGYNF